jgi:DNA polymerase I-like protein with 3'-5' exonuclease and polymerase domains
MLVKADVKGLEVVVAAQLSQDSVLRAEILDKQDTHANNQAAFRLPDRITAKRFIFKLLYGATDYGFANDADFLSVGFSQKQWAGVIEAFYGKYHGIHAWHKALIYEAQSTGRLTLPSGLYFPIVPDFNKSSPWPTTVIKNYPVQGFGAQLVALARCRIFQRIGEDEQALLVNTVHDSIAIDTTQENVYNIRDVMTKSVEEVPALCKQIWGYDFALPLTCEVKAGHNLADMTEI